MTRPARVEDLLRELAPQVLGALLRRGVDFGVAEDAVQEALLAAVVRWPEQGIPDSPAGWLITVAGRKLVDWRRRETARRPKEAAAVDWVPADELRAPAPDSAGPAHDDSLLLLFLCCHPALPRSAQVALTLRAVGGLTTAEIARAFLVPETTMARRITRGKRRIAQAGARFTLPRAAERPQRLAAILEVLYLIFNEGYTASSGTALYRRDLTVEAIRLTRALRDQARQEGEVAGLLALMLLTDSRRDARTDARGALVPLAEQDRSRWDYAQITEGLSLVAATLAERTVGPYQVQAAIAAVHAEATQPQDTDWLQIAGLYRLLEHLDPNPVVTLNRAVAVAMVDGPQAGLAMVDALDDDPRLAHHHRLAAVRAHLLEMTGDLSGARACYEQAARATASAPEQDYLRTRAARLRER